MRINPRRYKAARQDRDGWDSAPRSKCSRATLIARENIDTSEQAQPGGSLATGPHHAMRAAGQAGCAKAIVMRGARRPRIRKVTQDVGFSVLQTQPMAARISIRAARGSSSRFVAHSLTLVVVFNVQNTLEIWVELGYITHGPSNELSQSSIGPMIADCLPIVFFGNVEADYRSGTGLQGMSQVRLYDPLAVVSSPYSFTCVANSSSKTSDRRLKKTSGRMKSLNFGGRSNLEWHRQRPRARFRTSRCPGAHLVR